MINLAMEEIRIRKARRRDIASLAELLGQLFDQEADFQSDKALQSKGLSMIIAKPKTGRILVLEAGGEIRGMVNLLYSVSTALGAKVAVLEDLIVHRDYRGLGYGHRLLAAAIDEARRRGCRRVTLLTDCDNRKAIDFYHRHGFGDSHMVPLRLMLDQD